MVVCVSGDLQRSKIKRTGPRSEPKFLTREEWTRINDHLVKFDSKQQSNNQRGKIKNLPPLSLKASCSRTRPSKKNDNVCEEDSVKKENRNQKIINRAKTVLFENKDYARRLLRGLRLSTILHERNSQIDFNKRLEYEKQAKDVEIKSKLKQDLINYEEELRAEKFKKTEKTEMFRKELDKQILEKLERGRRDEEEKAKEKIDIIQMTRDITALMDEERFASNEKKLKIKQDIENYTTKESEIRKVLRMKEKEEENMNEIYRSVAFEIDKIRKNKERSRFRITEKPVEMEKRPDDVKSNQDKKLKELLLERERRKNELLQDLLHGQKMALEELKKREDDHRRERELSFKRRQRKEEADRVRARMEREERERAMKKTMKYYIMQWIEKEEEKKMEKQFDSIYAPDFSKENELILKYCDEILSLVKCGKRPLYPVIAAVKEIKKEFGLECGKNPSFLKSNVPIGN